MLHLMTLHIARNVVAKVTSWPGASRIMVTLVTGTFVLLLAVTIPIIHVISTAHLCKCHPTDAAFQQTIFKQLVACKWAAALYCTICLHV